MAQILTNRQLSGGENEENTGTCPLRHEEARLKVLRGLNLLDTPLDENFDRITRMASRLFQAPLSAISFTDQHRQWFKSHVGASSSEISSFQSPCAEVTQSAEVLIIPDLQADSRFAAGSFARSGMRFYAGAPLITSDGYVLGAICVLDKTPRTVSTEEIKGLGDLASMIMAQVELEHDFGSIDPVSLLPNRSRFIHDLQKLEQDSPGKTRANLMIDLADPRSFNQMVSVLSATYVDDVVKASSLALREALGPQARFYHIGAASYALILDESAGESWLDNIKKISLRLQSPIICKGIPIMMNAVFGVSLFSLGDLTAQDALRTALSAVQDARQAEAEYSVYSSASDEASQRRLTLLIDMGDALVQHDQLTLAYQPRIDLRTEACIGAEALLRWRNPRFGNVSPGEFIPLVEQTALAQSVTQWVIEAAVEQVSMWQQTGHQLRVSINVSALNLEEPDFVQRLANALRRFGVSTSAIELELTESALIRNSSRVLNRIQEIRAMGIELAVDDFGTGYSTFSYLQKLPATTVKLDQSFIRVLNDSRKDQLLVRSMILMAHDLGYRVVAEGVETAEAYAFLKDLSCDEVQGYFISRPLTANAFETWLQQRALSSLAGNTNRPGKQPLLDLMPDSAFALQRLQQIHLLKGESTKTLPSALCAPAEQEHIQTNR